MLNFVVLLDYIGILLLTIQVVACSLCRILDAFSMRLLLQVELCAARLVSSFLLSCNLNLVLIDYLYDAVHNLFGMPPMLGNSK